MNICMIPVRSGSERLSRKNYLKLGDVSVMERAVIKARHSNAFDRIVINTDDPKLEEVASDLRVDFYLRSDKLSSSAATSDEVVLDFFQEVGGSRVFWVNTASPLQPVSDIVKFVQAAVNGSWSSGVSVNSTQVHALYENAPLNFNWASGFARTQDLKRISLFNYAIMMWDVGMLETLRAGQLFDDYTNLFESSRWSGLLLKNQEDYEYLCRLEKVAPNQGLGGASRD